MWLRLSGEGHLFNQVYTALRTAILSGELRTGARLPSTRSLADEIGVSRNTVMQAYEQLAAEGYVSGQPGSGTYVSQSLREHALPDPLPSATTRADAQGGRLSASCRRAMEDHWRWTPKHTPPEIDFRYGRPPYQEIPFATLRRLVARRIRRHDKEALDYAMPQGPYELREALADYLRRARGVNTSPDRIVVLTGSQQGIDVAARMIVDPGDAVVLEELHYAGARLAFEASGGVCVGMRLDDQGLCVDDLSSLGSEGVRLVYVTPSHQFPTGAVLPLARRLRLLEWAQKNDVYILEDDYDSEFRLLGRPIESLQGLDRMGRVIYVGTFSKVCFPSMRVGFAVLPAALVDPFCAMKSVGDPSGMTLPQLALADFIREGYFERHLRRLRRRNRAQRDALFAAIDRHLGDAVEVVGSGAGLHVLVWLDGIRPDDLSSVISSAWQSGVAIYPASIHALDPPKRAGVILGYGCLEEDEIERGIQVLARVLREARNVLPKRGGRRARAQVCPPARRRPRSA